MENIKAYQNNWKREQRRLNTPYAQKQRELKRSEDSKERRRELRQDPERKKKAKDYQDAYRKRPDVIFKTKARYAARQALVTGLLFRPAFCEECGSLDQPLQDGRSGLRMDHYLGYDKENHLKVKFICVKCDGRQLRKHE